MPRMLLTPGHFSVIHAADGHSIDFKSIRDVISHGSNNGQVAFGKKLIYKIDVPKDGLGLKSLRLMIHVAYSTDTASSYNLLRGDDFVSRIKIIDSFGKTIQDISGDTYYDGLALSYESNSHSYNDGHRCITFVDGNLFTLDIPLPNVQHKDSESGPPYMFYHNLNVHNSCITVEITFNKPLNKDILGNDVIKTGINAPFDVKLLCDAWVNSYHLDIDDYVNKQFTFTMNEYLVSSTSNDTTLSYMLDMVPGTVLVSIHLVDLTKVKDNDLVHSIDDPIEVIYDGVSYFHQLNMIEYLSTTCGPKSKYETGVYDMSPLPSNRYGFSYAGHENAYNYINGINKNNGSTPDSSYIKITASIVPGLTKLRKYSVVIVLGEPANR